MPDQSPPSPPIRRIVTTHDADGKSIVGMDGPASNHKWGSHGGNVSTLIWCTDQTPAEIWGTEDFGARIVNRQPPPKGVRICMIDFYPGNPGMMHRTDTVDYVICLSGEIDMELDDSTVTMRAGDVMVQQGTNHSWVNRGTETARLGFLLLDGKPLPDGATPSPILAAGQDAPTEGGTPPSPPIRRIVTTHDKAGRAIVGFDAPAGHHKWSGRGTVSTLLWSSDEAPAEIWAAEDYGARVLGTQPPAKGSRFCMIDYPPGTPGRMHRTDTIDIIFCLSGGIDMALDDGIVHLNPGDVMVQQGTNHSWINNGTETCRLAIALIDGKPGKLEITA